MDSSVPNELSEAAKAHTGKAASLLEVDETAKVGSTIEEHVDLRRQEKTFYLSQTSLNQRVDGQVFHANLHLQNVRLADGAWRLTLPALL